MTAAMAMPGNTAETFLVHFFGTRYVERRARGDCTSCGKPAQGAAECQVCCDAARARYDARRAAGVWG